MTAQRRRAWEGPLEDIHQLLPLRIEIEVHGVVVDADHPVLPAPQQPLHLRIRRLLMVTAGRCFGVDWLLANCQDRNRYWFTSARSRILWRQVASSTSGNLSHTSSSVLLQKETQEW